MVYGVVLLFTGDRRWAVLGVVFTLTSYNFVWRSSQTWPETQALPLYLLALYGFERQRGDRRALILVGLALVVIAVVLALSVAASLASRLVANAVLRR